MKCLIRLICLPLLLLAAGETIRAQHLGDYRFKYAFEAKTSPRHEDEGSPARKIAASFKLYLSSRLSLTFANDNVVSKAHRDGTRTTGVGNSRLTFDADLITEDDTGIKTRPAVSVEYNLKLPTGSAAKGLSSGRVDHEIVGIVSKSVGDSIIDQGKLIKRTNLEVDFGGYFAGNSDRPGFTNTAELTLAITQTLDDLKVGKYTYHGEIDLSSAAKDSPSEIYAVNELSIVLPSNAVFRVGMRNGITPNSPKFAVYTSITFKGSFRKQK
jgi:hypothetical protein